MGQAAWGFFFFSHRSKPTTPLTMDLLGFNRSVFQEHMDSLRSADPAIQAYGLAMIIYFGTILILIAIAFLAPRCCLKKIPDMDGPVVDVDADGVELEMDHKS